jgi:hypothetical protein
MNARLRLDFVIALCALLISTVAAAATVYQTRVIARQFSATVWPYVSFNENSAPWQLALSLRNDGLGPAIVRSVRLTWDGNTEPSLEHVLIEIARAEPQMTARARAALRSGAKLRIATSTPTGGMVIPANSQHTILEVDGDVLVRYVNPTIKRIGITLCYCSLTGNCWSETFHDRAGEPTAVSSCPKGA